MRRETLFYGANDTRVRRFLTEMKGLTDNQWLSIHRAVGRMYDRPKYRARLRTYNRSWIKVVRYAEEDVAFGRRLAMAAIGRAYESAFSIAEARLNAALQAGSSEVEARVEHEIDELGRLYGGSFAYKRGDLYEQALADFLTMEQVPVSQTSRAAGRVAASIVVESRFEKLRSEIEVVRGPFARFIPFEGD